MSAFIVNYDLRKPGKDYTSLIKAIKSYPGWAALLKSMWGISTDSDAAQVRNHLRQHMDSNDGLLVIKAGNNWASSGLAQELNDWLKTHVAS